MSVIGSVSGCDYTCALLVVSVDVTTHVHACSSERACVCRQLCALNTQFLSYVGANLEREGGKKQGIWKLKY